MATIQERLRGIPVGWVDTALGAEAADRIDALEALIKENWCGSYWRGVSPADAEAVNAALQINEG